MAEMSLESIKVLRSLTNAGVMECKRALEEAGGDVARAEEQLRHRGIALAARKSDRTAKEGMVECYIHTGGRVGAMVEVNCETDFVARTPEFRDLVHDLAMQVAAMAPRYVNKEDMPSGDGVNAEEACLLEQSFIKDPSSTVGDVITAVVARVGENIRVRRFERFALGE